MSVGTPPLEAMRYIIHEAATIRSGEKMGSKVIMIHDVARAFFEASALRDACVEIPQLGIIRSLNVHVSGALMVWEYTRQQILKRTASGNM